LLEQLRDEAEAQGLPTMTVSAGDNAMGTLSQVVYGSAALEWRLMHRLGYDITTLGNHDFDLGLPSLAAALDAAETAGEIPSIVASNIYFSDESADDDALEAHYSEDPAADATIHEYRVIEADNGLRVGVLGYLGVDASFKSPFKAPVQFSEQAVADHEAEDPEKVLPHLYDDLQPVVDKLRNEGNADLVVALAHAGLAPGRPEISEDDRIAENVDGIDVIISGHAHETDDTPVIVENASTGKEVVVLNGAAHGASVGRIVLHVPDDPAGAITFDTETQGLVPVTDEIVPEPQYADIVEDAIGTIEASGDFDGETAVELLINRSLAMSVANDPAVVGDLYFFELAQTSFDLPSKRSLAFLTADSHLATLDALGEPADFAFQSSGTIRTVLYAGKTGAITVADAFRVVPLGRSPFDATNGYPLVRVKISIGAVRVLLELTSGRGFVDSSYDMTCGAIVADYDCSRDPITSAAEAFVPDNGRITKLWMDMDHSDGVEQFDTLVWDRENPPDAPSVLGGPTYVMVTTSYIAKVLANGGIPLFDMNEDPVTPSDAVVFRPDGTEVKELESFFAYLYDQGTIPARYDEGDAEATSRFQRMAFCP